MLKPIDDGGPAFPANTCDTDYGPTLGMSLRAYFVGQAIPGIIAAGVEKKPLKYGEGAKSIAAYALAIADEAIKALEGRSHA